MSAQFPQFNAYTTRYLETLLVNNPVTPTFALSINGNYVATGDPTKPFIDVTRIQIINELQNRIANHKQNSIVFQNTIVNNASSIGAVAYSAAPAGEDAGVSPSTWPNGGPNPVIAISQCA